VVRSQVPWRGALDVLGMLPLAVPGLVMAFGYLSISVQCRRFFGDATPSWLDVQRFPVVLLVVAYATRRLPYGLRRPSSPAPAARSRSATSHHQVLYDKRSARSRLSESNPKAPVDVATLEWRPRIDGPSTVRCPRRTEQRIPSCLSHTRQVLPVDEEPNVSELPFRQQPENHVGLAHRSVRILVQALAAGVVPLNPHASDVLLLPHSNDACAVARCQRHVLLNRVDGPRARTYVYVVVTENGSRRSVPRSSIPRFVVGSGRLRRTYDANAPRGSGRRCGM